MPAGRPPTDKSFTNMLRIAVAETYDEVDGVKRTKLRALADAMVDKGIAGDVQAQNAIADRLEGKPKQQVELSGDEDNPLATSIAIRYIEAGK